MYFSIAIARLYFAYIALKNLRLCIQLKIFILMCKRQERKCGKVLHYVAEKEHLIFVHLSGAFEAHDAFPSPINDYFGVSRVIFQTGDKFRAVYIVSNR